MIKLNTYNYLVLANAIKNGASFKLVLPDDEVITTAGTDEDGDITFLNEKAKPKPCTIKNVVMW